MNANVVSQPAAVRIRRATAADACALAELGARIFFETFAADNTAEDMRLFLESTWRPELQRAEILDEGMDTLLACDATGALAGFAQVRVAHPPAGIEAHAPVELKRFYVDKPWHGSGLARVLMKAAEQAARERGGREFWLGVFQRNDRAVAFYRKCGFRTVGTQIFVVGTDPQKDYVMIRALE
jgi:ribosomal protein S18 acetylase RimI-like enzyme